MSKFHSCSCSGASPCSSVAEVHPPAQAEVRGPPELAQPAEPAPLGGTELIKTHLAEVLAHLEANPPQTPRMQGAYAREADVFYVV